MVILLACFGLKFHGDSKFSQRINSESVKEFPDKKASIGFSRNTKNRPRRLLIFN